eukprot:1157334-Pelagomonas_calceolata.AAC.11
MGRIGSGLTSLTIGAFFGSDRAAAPLAVGAWATRSNSVPDVKEVVPAVFVPSVSFLTPAGQCQDADKSKVVRAPACACKVQAAGQCQDRPPGRPVPFHQPGGRPAGAALQVLSSGSGGGTDKDKATDAATRGGPEVSAQKNRGGSNQSFPLHMERKGKGYIAVPAYMGSFAGAKRWQQPHQSELENRNET